MKFPTKQEIREMRERIKAVIKTEEKFKKKLNTVGLSDSGLIPKNLSSEATFLQKFVEQESVDFAEFSKSILFTSLDFLQHSDLTKDDLREAIDFMKEYRNFLSESHNYLGTDSELDEFLGVELLKECQAAIEGMEELYREVYVNGKVLMMVNGNAYYADKKDRDKH